MNDKIVVALEASDEGTHVFEVANRVAQKHHKTLDLINVVRPVVAYYPDINFSPLTDSTYALQRELVNGNRAYFEQIPNLDAEQLQIVEGNPVYEIGKTIEKAESNLAVMGVHNRRGLKRLMGSTTHGVLNSTNCDLLAVHPDGSKEDYKRIVIAVDTSKSLDMVLKKAAQFAAADAQHIDIVSVLASLTHLYPTPYTATTMTFSFAEFSAIIKKRTEEIVAEAAERAGLPKEAVTIRTGDPRDEIIAAAQESQADLIIVGSDNRGAINRLLLGSTARGVLDRTPCDVLVCRFQ